MSTRGSIICVFMLSFYVLRVVLLHHCTNEGRQEEGLGGVWSANKHVKPCHESSKPVVVDGCYLSYLFFVQSCILNQSEGLYFLIVYIFIASIRYGFCSLLKVIL